MVQTRHSFLFFSRGFQVLSRLVATELTPLQLLQNLHVEGCSEPEERSTERTLGLMRKTDTVCKDLVFERFSSPLQPDYLQRQKLQICTSDANSERKNARPRALSLIRATA